MLTKEQYENWRRVLVRLYGPIGDYPTDSEIEKLRNRIQEVIMSAKFEMVDLIREGCELSRYFPGLYQVTAGDPCRDCATVLTCPVREKLKMKAVAVPTKIPVETNAQIAARLNITKRQVAKRRKEGTLNVQSDKS